MSLKVISSGMVPFLSCVALRLGWSGPGSACRFRDRRRLEPLLRCPRRLRRKRTVSRCFPGVRSKRSIATVRVEMSDVTATDIALMREAIALAGEADAPFGAVIVKDGRVL